MIVNGIVSKRLPKGTWGEADQIGGIAYISTKCKGIKDLEISVHEMLHILCPWLSEDAVRIIGSKIARNLWARNYRRITDEEVSELQDEEHGLTDSAYILGKPDDDPVA